MTRKIHHQKDYDKGDKRIKQAAYTAMLIWKLPFEWKK